MAHLRGKLIFFSSLGRHLLTVVLQLWVGPRKPFSLPGWHVNWHSLVQAMTILRIYVCPGCVWKIILKGDSSGPCPLHSLGLCFPVILPEPLFKVCYSYVVWP